MGISWVSQPSVGQSNEHDKWNTNSNNNDTIIIMTIIVIIMMIITIMFSVQQVQDAMLKLKANPKLRDLLERLKDFPNIPRKQAKFEVEPYCLTETVASSGRHFYHYYVAFGSHSVVTVTIRVTLLLYPFLGLALPECKQWWSSE